MKNILLIDDEELVLKSVNKLLLKQGYSVQTCKNGKEALQAIQSSAYDLIICDIRMPEISGVETIRQIREFYSQHHKQSVPEILITGYADEQMTKEAEALKVADYLYKPFDLTQFLDCIKKHLKI